MYEAIAMMAENSIGALLVVSNGLLVGIMSERDYARKVVLQSRSSKETRVSDIMTSPVITVSPAHTVEECMRLMTDKRIRHFRSSKAPTIAGIVSIGDLVRSVITVQGETIQYLQQYINGHYQTLTGCTGCAGLRPPYRRPALRWMRDRARRSSAVSGNGRRCRLLRRDSSSFPVGAGTGLLSAGAGARDNRRRRDRFPCARG